eukprot:520354_1
MADLAVLLLSHSINVDYVLSEEQLLFVTTPDNEKHNSPKYEINDWRVTRTISKAAYCIGIKRLIVCITYDNNNIISQDTFIKIKTETQNMLKRIGYKECKQIPFIPINITNGDNIYIHGHSDKDMSLKWYKGFEFKLKPYHQKLSGYTLHDAICHLSRNSELASNRSRIRYKRDKFILPISKVFYSKRNGGKYIVCGRIGCGKIEENDYVKLISCSNLILNNEKQKDTKYKIVSIERNYESLSCAGFCDVIGIELSPNFSTMSKPCIGDVICVYDKMSNWNLPCSQFTVQAEIIESINNVKMVVGKYSGLIYVICSKSVCKLVKINWKMIRDEDGDIEKEVKDAEFIENGEYGELIFESQQPLIIAMNNKCRGLNTVMLIHHNSILLSGTIVSCK